MTFLERLMRWTRGLFGGTPDMMTCREQVELLADYLDGVLDPDAAKALEQHLADCPSCLNFIATYKTTTAWVREMACEEMPEELRDRLATFLKAKIREGKAGADQS